MKWKDMLLHVTLSSGRNRSGHAPGAPGNGRVPDAQQDVPKKMALRPYNASQQQNSEKIIEEHAKIIERCGAAGAPERKDEKMKKNIAVGAAKRKTAHQGEMPSIPMEGGGGDDPAGAQPLNVADKSTGTRCCASVEVRSYSFAT
eukprot:gene22497-biopygen23734